MSLFRTSLVQTSSGRILKNQKGQGLIEYLVIVALMGVATIGIIRVMGEVVSKRFASAAAALQDEKTTIGKAKIDASVYKKKTLGNFFNGATEKGQSSGDGDQ